MKKLPEEFLRRMTALLGEDGVKKYLEAFENDAQRSLRVNTDKMSVDDFIKSGKFDIEKIPYAENGFYFGSEKVGSHPYHHAGIIYVQEPAAMLPAECIDIKEDWAVLDTCSAPGGKSTQLKNKLGEKGVLVSNEIIPSRCKILTGNIERLGLKNVITTCTDLKRLSELFPKCFDLVCVDAPCSGEGMFRKDENAIAEWSEENVLKCAERQSEILSYAAQCVRDGGYILYATCTFSPEENEMQIDSFLSSHPDFELVRLTQRAEKATQRGIRFENCECENIEYCGRFYQHTGKGEGQFMAVLKNKAEDTSRAYPVKNILKKADSKILFDFLDDTLEGYNKSFVQMYKDTPVYFTDEFSLPAPVAFSCGVTIGEIKKNYILPHHQFFSAMGNMFKRRIFLSSDSAEAEKYLRGETFEVGCENGWAAVFIDGAAVGGAKVVSGVIKNHYPKGLRNF